VADLQFQSLLRLGGGDLKTKLKNEQIFALLGFKMPYTSCKILQSNFWLSPGNLCRDTIYFRSATSDGLRRTGGLMSGHEQLVQDGSNPGYARILKDCRELLESAI
jgi:hypothetical protein